MSGKPLITVLNAPAAEERLVSVSTLVSDYWALTKPEVNFLILITTFAGFYLGCANAGRQFSFLALFDTLLGTLLVASGTATLNQYIERKFDAQMRRTSRRPLAAGRLEPSAVLAFGIGLSAAGTVCLAIAAGVLASLLALLTLLSYLFLYTPLKRRTPLCVLVGAFPGAMPPLIGWAAASGRLNVEAWLLYCIVFLWQFPHFMAIAWMYREDYDRAGYIVLPQGQSRLRLVVLQTILPLLVLIAIDLLPTLPGQLAFLYRGGALALSFVFFYYGAEFVLRRSRSAARRLLVASILYLPLLLLLMTHGKAQRI
jgi:protoheme IX farnesyltransferase